MAVSPAEPASASERLLGLDVLRGVALCGILVMNVQTFALASAAYVRPTLTGPLTGLDLISWLLTHVLGDLKFFSLFSMGFGASLGLATEGQPDLAKFHARQRWLLAFGLIHGFLVWHGDVLFTYAVVGWAVVGARQWPTPRLIRTAAVLLIIPLIIVPAYELLLPFSPLVERLTHEGFDPSPDALASEALAYRGSWLTQLPVRVWLNLELNTFGVLTESGFRSAGFMLLGFVLWREGVFAGRHREIPARLRRWGFGLGLPLAGISAAVLLSRDFPWNSGLSLSLINYVASIGVALGWAGVVLGLANAAPESRVVKALALTGRWSLTHYLSQSLICTLLFYGEGFGLYGQLPRWALVLVALGIWSTQVTLSTWLVKRWPVGPMERLWRGLVRRSLSSGHSQV